MFLIIIILIVLILLYGCYWYQTKSEYAKKLNEFPGPKFYPIFGNILGYSNKIDVLYKQLRATIASYNETWRAWSGYNGSLHIVTADDAEIILSSVEYIDKSVIYDFFIPWLGTGLLTSSGAKWHRRRKILTPAFHFNILRKFVTIFGECCDDLVIQLKEESKKTKVDIIPLLSRFTMASICETAMGLKIYPQDKLQSKYIETIHKLSTYLVYRVMSPWLHPNFIYYISPTYFKYSKYLKFMHNFTSNVIKTRESNFKDCDVNNLNETNELNVGFKGKRLAMLDLLISLKRTTGEIDDEGIREEVDTFIFEGHDTTAASANFTILLLAEHSDIQMRVIKELDEIFGDSKRQPTYEDLQNMKYLDRCIKESLRLFPSVPFISREFKKDIQLTHHIAPAGVVLLLHIYNIHRDPKYYPDPEKFDPDRFLPENSRERHSYAYIPFSAGPRNCIGQKFAMLELKCLVSSILRNFTITAIDTRQNLTFVIDMITRIKGSINLKFTPRN